MSQLQIGCLIYPGVIQLDVMGTYQVLAFPQNTQVHLIWKIPSAIVSNEGLTLVPDTTFADCPPLELMLEYDPEPPFKAGTPETAGTELVQSLKQLGQPLLDAFLAQTRDIASRL
ncbi:MAG: hypothetical protein F6K19_42345 [Cyanothece sp. SIO1E1]|nr:hypothetical protein [Cyanothece sp. SIO1E1]